MKKTSLRVVLSRKKYDALAAASARAINAATAQVHAWEVRCTDLQTAYDKLHNVAQKFAEQKERDAETIAKLTRMLEAK